MAEPLLMRAGHRFLDGIDTIHDAPFDAARPNQCHLSNKLGLRALRLAERGFDRTASVLSRACEMTAPSAHAEAAMLEAYNEQIETDDRAQYQPPSIDVVPHIICLNLDVLASEQQTSNSMMTSISVMADPALAQVMQLL